MIISDVNFPSSPEEILVENNLSKPEILALRAKYLEYAYRAMSRFSRGSVLIQQVKVVTSEMIEASLVRGSL